MSGVLSKYNFRNSSPMGNDSLSKLKQLTKKKIKKEISNEIVPNAQGPSSSNIQSAPQNKHSSTFVPAVKTENPFWFHGMTIQGQGSDKKLLYYFRTLDVWFL